MEQLFILLVIFCGISIVFSMIGMGGGILYVPILLFAGYSIKEAPAISLVLILATSLAAILTFFKNNKIDIKLALIIDPATNIMAFIGGFYSSIIPEKILVGLLVAVLIVAGILMLRKLPQTAKEFKNKKAFWLWNRDFNGEKYTVNLPLTIIIAGFIGLLAGMLGITGGIIKLPMMVLLCGVPMDIAIGTSTVMVAFTALSGLLGHTLNGSVNWEVAIFVAISAVIGGLIGSKISIKANKDRLKQFFGVMVLFISAYLMVKYFF